MNVIYYKVGDSQIQCLTFFSDPFFYHFFTQIYYSLKCPALPFFLNLILKKIDFEEKKIDF